MLKLFSLVVLLLIPLLLKPVPANAARSTTYSVWEVEIQEGSIAGERFRFAVIDWPNGDVAQHIEFGRERLFIKDQSLGDVSVSSYEIAAWKKDEEKIRAEHRQTFRSLFQYDSVELERLKNQKEVRFAIRLTKSCPVEIETVTKNVWGSNTSGIITIPKRIKQTVTEITPPSCYSKSDRTIKLPPSANSQSEAVRTQQAQSAKEAAEKQAIHERNERTIKLERELQGVAYRYAKEDSMIAAAVIPPSDQSLEAQVKRKVCPAIPALMKALKVSAIELDRTSVKGTTSDGYHTVTTTTIGHLVLNDGSKIDMRHMLMHSYFLVVKSIVLEPKGCVTVKMMPSANPTDEELDKSVKAVETVLHRYLRDLAYEQSAKAAN